HGVGGVGKTTLISHVLERITTTQELVANPVDYVTVELPLSRESLTQELSHSHSRRLADVPGSATPNESLSSLLTRALGQSSRPVIVVLDEFEKNIPYEGSAAVPTPEATEALSALINALTTVQGPHRVVITSRFLPKVPGIEQLADVPLNVLKDHFLQCRI